jgi:ABC-type bacteriocin/lantibiotic exporter with double-glycine peptidase domain
MTPNRHRGVAWVTAALLAFAGAISSAAPPAPPEQWRNDNACGVNCLYVLLKLSDVKVDYGALFARLLRGERETSLLDLQRVAGEYGLRCEGGRSTPQGLQSARGAVICHTENAITGKGHFVLVLRADEDGVVTMDGTTCLLRRASWSTFRTTWSGYVLFPKESSTARVAGVATFAASLVATWVGLSLVPRLLRRPPSSHP